ncbi:MAG: ABC transporter permease [Clostridiales bacterium]|nr:ABC transporter permease [Clostridiales bacterium]
MFWENIKEAFSSIFSNKMRSLLTMLGIIIGISAVIIITTIGNSIQRTLTATLNSLGGNTVAAYVQPRYPVTDEEREVWVYPEMEEDDYVTQEMVDGLIEQYSDEIEGIVAQATLGTGQIRDEADAKNFANVVVRGVTPEYLKYLKLEMPFGRSFTLADNLKEKKVCMLADKMVSQYFGDKNPIGETVSVSTSEGSFYDFVVIGVYKYNEAAFGVGDTTIPEKERSTELLIPLQTCFRLQGGHQKGYDMFNLLLTPLADVETATIHISEYFKEVYADNKNFEVETYNMQSGLGMINTVLNVITIAVSGIAAISLIVGGVGVMNIMLVSITERTKEIGVRMAMGAKRSIIRSQFVIEAIVLCLIGGIIGILIGVGIGAILGMAANFIVQNMYSEYANYIIMEIRPSGTAILLSVFFSMLTGVFFGYYPANKAAKMEVIDALRYE